jgi:hypothetical protein
MLAGTSRAPTQVSPGLTVTAEAPAARVTGAVAVAGPATENVSETAASAAPDATAAHFGIRTGTSIR